MITNISFDLWLTLIKSHPSFKIQRAQMIADSYNPDGLSVSKIETYIRDQDKVFDRHNEIIGKKIPAVEMYFRILKGISRNSENVSMETAQRLEEQSNELFIEYCPQLLNDSVPYILEQLREDGYVLNLASNTGFIEGKTIRKVLEKLGILRHFLFYIFSDEVNASKPSPHFFQRVYDEINVQKNQVLHIGDNPKTDYKGALDFGFEALLITNTNYTLNDVKSRL